MEIGSMPEKGTINTVFSQSLRVEYREKRCFCVCLREIFLHRITRRVIDWNWSRKEY